MDFQFSEEQDTIRGLAHQILESEAPIERVAVVERTPEWHDAALWRRCAEANLLGITIPERYGGMEMGFSELCVLLEEVGWVTAPGPWLAALVLGALPIAQFGGEQQQAHWLPRVAAGEAILSAALEDAGSSDPRTPATCARADGEGFLLSGTKTDVPFAAAADAVLVPATGDDGVAVFLLDPKAEGVVAKAGATTTGEPLFTLALEDVRVPASARLPADGAEVVGWLQPRVLAAIAAMQVGVSDRAIRITADYTTERQQFNVPIGSFQAVAHRQADSFIDLQAMRWTAWRAIWRLSEGLPAEREAWVAKYWAADAGSRIANASVHLHGGLGSDMDYPIHRHFLWSKSLELQFGGASASLALLAKHMSDRGRLEEA